jgi:hypothetical protein
MKCDGCFQESDVKEMGDLNYCEACGNQYDKMQGVVGLLAGYFQELQDEGQASLPDIRGALLALPAPYNV